MPEIRAIERTFDEWTEQDAGAVATYLDQMEAGDARDAAITGFANEHVRDDPNAAATWAAAIGDEETRFETLQQVGSRWYREDPEQATNWMIDNSISAQQQQEIISYQPERGDWGRGGGRRGGR